MAFDQAIADRICERIESGDSLRKAASAEGTSHSTVLTWLDDPERKVFADQYARARARQYAMLADEIMEIADDGDPLGDKMDPERVARAKLRVDTRKWMLSKMLPKVYGDKLETTLTGPNGGAIQVSARKLDSAELMAIAAQAIKK